jgi:hypothetical protein
MARMRPKLQYGEEIDSMSLDCMQLKLVVIPQKAQSQIRFKYNLNEDSEGE